MDDLHLYHGLARRYRPAAHINISTNGYFTKRTIAFLQRVDRRNMSITISYDGLRSHDSIRGVEGSAERLLETAQAIRDAFRGVALSLKMTVTNENHAEILDTALRCVTYGIPFRFKTLEKLKCHQGRLPSEIQGPCYPREVIESMTNQAREILRLRIRTNGRYIKKLIRMHTGKTVKPNCFADAVFIAIDGQVFICRQKDAIGSVFQDPLDRIWHSAARKELLREMKACRMAPDCLSFTNE
jgi:MoaA/NifB/PqqE/SkfB family radical SAM enzyme